MRWIAVGLLFGAGTVLGRADTLSTSAVTYCAPPENVLVQELDVTYFKKNASVVFDVTASSLSADLRVSLALNLTVYGLQPVSLNLNLCDLSSAICPLPLYNFSGFGTLPIPASFSSKIPSIGYTVPDLEAFAQLELRRVDTGEVAACVSATLTNGWSMRQRGATWAAVGVVLFSIVMSGVWAVSQARWGGRERGLWTEKEAWRVVDIVSFVQSIAVSAMLNINYSSAYKAFSLNFPFIMLLNGPIPSQSAIDHLRERTGARLGDDALPTDEYVNRKSSPYNAFRLDSSSTLGNVVQTFKLGNNLGYTISSSNATEVAVPPLNRRAFINPATVTSADSLPGGIPLYVNGAGVATANAFLSLFFEWLVIGAVVLIAYLAYILFRRISRNELRHEKGNGGRGSRMIHGMFLRLCLILILPVSIFAFYQWTLHDSWLATLLSVICLLTTWAGVFWAWIRLSFHSGDIQDGRRSRLGKGAPVIALYAVPPFIVALFVAFARKSGTTQVIAILVIEIFSLVAAIIIRWRSRRAERDTILNDSPSPMPTPSIPPPTRLSITLRVLRIIGSGLMIAFISSLGVKPIPRTVIGIVASAVWSLGVVWAFICVVWGLVKLVRRRRKSGGPIEEREREKGVVEGKEGQESKEIPGPEIYEGNAPFVSPRPYPQTFRTDSDRTQYFDAHTGTTPAQAPQNGDYFHAR